MTQRPGNLLGIVLAASLAPLGSGSLQADEESGCPAEGEGSASARFATRPNFVSFPSQMTSSTASSWRGLCRSPSTTRPRQRECRSRLNTFPDEEGMLSRPGCDGRGTGGSGAPPGR